MLGFYLKFPHSPTSLSPYLPISLSPILQHQKKSMPKVEDIAQIANSSAQALGIAKYDIYGSFRNC